MATLKSVIDMVDEIKPNAFSNEAKTCKRGDHHLPL